MLHAGVDGGVDEGEVLLQPVLGFGGGDHEQSLDALQRRGYGGLVAVAGARRRRSRQLRRSGGIAKDQPQRQVLLRQHAGHHPAHLASGSGDGDRGYRGGVGCAHGYSIFARGNTGLATGRPAPARCRAANVGTCQQSRVPPVRCLPPAGSRPAPPVNCTSATCAPRCWPGSSPAQRPPLPHPGRGPGPGRAPVAEAQQLEDLAAIGLDWDGEVRARPTAGRSTSGPSSSWPRPA